MHRFSVGEIEKKLISFITTSSVMNRVRHSRSDEESIRQILKTTARRQGKNLAGGLIKVITKIVMLNSHFEFLKHFNI